MLANRSKDTRPELALRRELHRLGLRYRVNARPLPMIHRTADVVFPRRKVAVFLDGCFWHGCPDHYSAPKANATFWQDKLERNIGRDRQVDELLEQAGWRVIRIWEHESPITAAAHVAEIVRST